MNSGSKERNSSAGSQEERRKRNEQHQQGVADRADLPRNHHRVQHPGGIGAVPGRQGQEVQGEAGVTSTAKTQGHHARRMVYRLGQNGRG